MESEAWTVEDVAHESARATIHRGRIGDYLVAIKVRKDAWRGPLPERGLGRPIIHAQDLDDEGRLVTVMEWLEGHRLVDELGDGVAIDIGRVSGVLERLRQGLHTKHGALRTDQIFMVDGEVPVLTGRDAPLDEIALDAYAAPELIDTREITLASNGYALGVILYELLTGRPPFASPHEAIAAGGRPPPMRGRRPGLAELEDRIAACLRLDPSRRHLVQLSGFWIDAPFTKRKRGYRTADPQEGALLAALRTDPRDAETRRVYADWLEQHGLDLRAERLRAEDGVVDREQDPGIVFAQQDPEGAPWRAIVSRAKIDRCVTFTFACPKRWDALQPTAFDDVRYCSSCDKPVYFVTSTDEAHERGARQECVAIDSGLVKREALEQYDDGVPRPPVPPRFDGQIRTITLGMVAPREPPPRPSLWRRLLGRRQ